VLLAARLPTWAGVVGLYPALAAIPLAWAAMWIWSFLASRRPW